MIDNFIAGMMLGFAIALVVGINVGRKHEEREWRKAALRLGARIRELEEQRWRV